jgi:hypothetical protein
VLDSTIILLPSDLPCKGELFNLPARELESFEGAANSTVPSPLAAEGNVPFTTILPLATLMAESAGPGRPGPVKETRETSLTHSAWVSQFRPTLGLKLERTIVWT